MPVPTLPKLTNVFARSFIDMTVDTIERGEHAKLWRKEDLNGWLGAALHHPESPVIGVPIGEISCWWATTYVMVGANHIRWLRGSDNCLTSRLWKDGEQGSTVAIRTRDYYLSCALWGPQPWNEAILVVVAARLRQLEWTLVNGPHQPFRDTEYIERLSRAVPWFE